MNGFEGLLASDFGFNPQPKSALMAASNRSTAGDQDSLFGSAAVQKTHDFDHLFCGSSAFSGLNDFSAAKNSSSSGLHDKPVYDDDIFEGLSSFSSGRGGFDDPLAGFGKSGTESKSGGSTNVDRSSSGFEDLIPGFGRSSPAKERSGASWHSETTFSTSETTQNVTENPSVVLESSSPEASSSSELFTDPLEISKPNTSGTVKVDSSTKADAKTYDVMDPFDGLGKFAPKYTSDGREMENDKGPAKTYKDPNERTSVRSPEQSSVDSDQEAHDMPKVSISSHNSVGQTFSPSLHADAKLNETDLHHKDMFTESEERFNFDSSGDVWLTVSEVPLSTEPTSAPPPSRPPARPSWVAKDKTKSFCLTGARRKNNDISNINSRSSAASPFYELGDFTSGMSQKDVNYHANGLSTEEFEMNSTAAAMKDAMDRAEAKFRHAKEVKGRETTKSSRSREQLGKEKFLQDTQDHESIQREMEEEERLQKRLDKERERAKEIERERETEREREHARQAVQRATREARERAAAEARLKAERAAVGKINAEARKRAAAEAWERAEKAAAEARGRVNSEAQDRADVAKTRAEAQLRAERAAVQRAGQEARERAAAAARLKQQKNASAPRPRATPSDPLFNTQFQNKQGPGMPETSGTSPSMKKASSDTNITDDLASIFGGASSGDFQDVEGGTKERPRPSLEKHRRTRELPVKALEEKKQRDLQAQRDQVERHRIAETLDIEIKRWAAGKEGNLRALLSTLQYVLWPECGWQPVSLTDLISAAMVKKVYRKSTLCTHPDKVQQKGATLQQKYIAEKVFDILQEGWNKFKSEELF